LSRRSSKSDVGSLEGEGGTPGTFELRLVKNAPPTYIKRLTGNAAGII
jgi:hypothetical protein